jgi:uncharacterized protein (TIGR00251 family)
MTIGDGSLTVEIVAKPGASRRGIVRIDPRGLVVALNSAPEKGKANDELIEFLSRELKIPRSSFQIVRGETSRHKTIRMGPCDPSVMAARLSILAAAELC